MKRRTFLQRFGSILAALGAIEGEWFPFGNRYYQALAQPSPRKLALLIGINQYSQQRLYGCVTDVDLQRELLIHRFGFQPSDILCLTDEQATKDKIETAFLEHLIKFVQPGDVVVFHFSGYGSRVKLETSESRQNALVPVNAEWLAQENKIVNCLLEETLLLMLRSLATDNITAVLDTSYYDPINIQPTGLRNRVRPMPQQAIVAASELDFHQKLKNENSGPDTVVLTATSDPKQLAREVLLSGFSAGLFTYALTQYLWEATEAKTIQISLSRVASSLQQLSGSKQQPALLSGDKNQNKSALLGEIFVPDMISACGVVTATEEDGKTVQLWLAGLPFQVQEYYGVHSRFILVGNVETRTVQSLQLRSRSGLTAKAQIYGNDGTISAYVGQLIQEAVRVLPRNINLTVALDTGLERIERVDATSAFATVARVSLVVALEQPADYVFGKLLEAKIKDSPATTSTIVSPRRYGLFSLGGELIPNTVGEAGEVVKVAVQRLAPKLQSLLAAKLWRLTENEGSTRLFVKATLEVINNPLPRVLMQRETARFSTQTNQKLLTQTAGMPTVAIGSRIQYRVQNMSERPVYLMLLGLNSSRTAIALYPWLKSSEDAYPMLKNVVIAPEQTITVPQTTSGFEWVVQGPASISETQLIFSTAPFTQTLTVLESAKQPRADYQRILPLLNPLEVAQAVLQDLHNASAVTDMNGSAADSYVLDVNNWASLSFVYQVV